MDANKRQVGGSHYGLGRLQHWDLSIMFMWDPFQYQIIKYVMRWKDKHATPGQRKTDLLKAQHFLEKYLENFEAFDKLAHPKDYEPKQEPAKVETGSRDFPGYQNEGYYGDMTSLWKCWSCKETFRAESPVGHVCNLKETSNETVRSVSPASDLGATGG